MGEIGEEYLEKVGLKLREKKSVKYWEKPGKILQKKLRKKSGEKS